MRVSQTKSNPAQETEVSRTKEARQVNAAEIRKKNDKTSASDATHLSKENTEISARSKEFAKAKAVANSAPDIREEKIAELKRRIAEGKYRVDSHAVADRLVEDHLKTDLD